MDRLVSGRREVAEANRNLGLDCSYDWIGTLGADRNNNVGVILSKPGLCEHAIITKSIR